MVYVSTFAQLRDKARALTRARPSTTRLTMKYRHEDKMMVIKVTDNNEVSH